MDENGEKLEEVREEAELKKLRKKERSKGRKEGIFISLGVVLVITLIGLSVTLVGKIINGTFVSSFLKGVAGEQASIVTEDVKEKLDVLQSAISYYYLDEVNGDDLRDGLYKGLLGGLGDPYSVYYTEKEYNEMMEGSEGVYYGIGAYLQQNAETLEIKVIKPIPGTPAEEVGILPDDILKEVDDEDITQEDINVVVSKIKGAEGTKVLLAVQRTGEDELVRFEITRRRVEAVTVEYEMLENKIGYIAIMEFDDITRDQFQAALNDLQEHGMKSLLLDLRDNPGGNLDVVVDIADMLLPEGLVVYTEDKYGNREELTTDAEHYFDKPMVVLVNGNSASASEILAGAIKDYKSGTLLGTTTYGKGIVQQIVPLGDGTGVKLTVSKYYTPSGQNIHGIGIEPDETLEFDYDAYKEDETDNQLNRAVELLK